jgi:hypothetical protein
LWSNGRGSYVPVAVEEFTAGQADFLEHEGKMDGGTFVLRRKVGGINTEEGRLK